MATHYSKQDIQETQPRLQVMRNIGWTISLTLLYVFVLVYIIVSQWSLWYNKSSSSPSFWIFSLFLDLFCALLLWRWLTRHLFIRSSVLTISKEGIQVGKLPTSTSDDLFIAWNEIASIYARRLTFTQVLCIRPKDTTQYLSRFGRSRKFFMRLQMRSGELINIPQIYMQKPASEVVALISSLYAQEVYDAAIELHS